MTGTLGWFVTGVNWVFVHLVAQNRYKKTAPFQGRGKFDREEVSAGRTRQTSSGTNGLTMYFAHRFQSPTAQRRQGEDAQ